MLHRLAFALVLFATPTLAQNTGLQNTGLQNTGLPFTATGRAALETGLDLAAAALANALIQSRDAAWAAGTLPIPPRIREALLTHYPASLLDSVEYRVGFPQDATLQALSIRYGKATAVTTIDIITFADPWDAENNVALWAHEVKHAEQFRAWGVYEFARAYVQDHTTVEAEAYAIGATFKALYGGG